MKIGCCCGLEMDRLQAVKQMGYDYAELPLETLARMAEAEFVVFCKEAETLKLPFENFYLFFPANFVLLGPQASAEELEQYVRLALRRMHILGGKKLVFGSSWARKVPDGYTYEKAEQELVAVCRKIGPIAQKFAITIVMEPLCPRETDLINTVAQGAQFVRKVEQAHIRLLADLYHMGEQEEDAAALSVLKDVLRHAHIARPHSRTYPLPDDGFDYRPFLRALLLAGVQTLSVEASSDDFSADAARSLSYLRGLVSECTSC